MNNTVKKNLIMLLVLVAAIFVCMFFANQIQKDFGDVIITEGCIEVDDLGILSRHRLR